MQIYYFNFPLPPFILGFIRENHLAPLPVFLYAIVAFIADLACAILITF